MTNSTNTVQDATKKDITKTVKTVMFDLFGVINIMDAISEGGKLVPGDALRVLSKALDADYCELAEMLERMEGEATA